MRYEVAHGFAGFVGIDEPRIQGKKLLTSDF